MQHISRAVSIAFNNLPRPHRIMLGSLAFITFIVTLWKPYVYHPSSESPIIKTGELEKNQLNMMLPEVNEPIDQDSSSPAADLSKDEIDEDVPYKNGIHDYIISTGDTLSNVLNQYGIDMADISQLVKVDKELRNLQIGQQLSWKLNDDGQLQHLSWEVSRHETRTYDRSADTFTFAAVLQKGEWQNKVLSGGVNGSFVNSARRAGLSNSEISAVIKSLQWQMDFHKLRTGDQFTVLMSREMMDGKSEHSELQGVRIHTGGKDYYAIRTEDGKFYDRSGFSMARGFMRFPTLKQYRVTSNFNPRRVNPVTGRIAPHKGVDFAVPIGTPVLAVGDGEIIVAKHSGAAGNYVAIRHGRQYITRYMHLKKLLVKPGEKVKRGDRIALSGNTGRSIGPHVHYEIWVNNQAVNPLTAKLPRMENLIGKERCDYLAQVRIVVTQLRFK